MGDVTEKNPFGKFARRFDSILVFYILDHMFCFVDMDDFSSVTVKSTPDEIEEIQMRHSSVSKPLTRASATGSSSISTATLRTRRYMTLSNAHMKLSRQNTPPNEKILSRRKDIKVWQVAADKKQESDNPIPVFYSCLCRGKGSAFDSCDTGKHLSFDSLEEGTATGRHIANLIGEAELVDACHGVSTTYEGERTVVGGLYDSLCDGA